ncbi:hypothetical protein [Planctomicrobium sp. SH664]|uniref:hypothetical protein n=1 Tax=Planctomicrobium sp. SH664 TaxID=3448125 RepID=UPI003F5C8C07
MSESQETEDQLIRRAQQALSHCNWEIGECASRWTQKFARGRTDVDFGVLIGMSGDQIYQRRRVWETFADVHKNYPKLKWSHFYVALNWDDSSECLQWAQDMEATIAEMKAWRRAQHGENLSEPAVEEPPFNIAPEYLSVGTGIVRDPSEFSRDGSSAAYVGSAGGEGGDGNVMVASAARDVANTEYTPFGKGARGSAPREGDGPRDEASTEQIVKKAAAALERVVAALTPEIIEEFHSLPIALQQRFLDAAENLQARAAGLS